MLPWWSHDVGHVTVLSQFLNLKPQPSMIQLQVAQPASLRSSNKNSWTSCWVLEAYSCNARSRVLAKGFGDQLGIHRAHWNCFQHFSTTLGFRSSLGSFKCRLVHGKNDRNPHGPFMVSCCFRPFQHVVGQSLAAINHAAGVNVILDQTHKFSGYSHAKIYGSEDFVCVFFCWNFQQPKKKVDENEGKLCWTPARRCKKSFWHRPNIKEITPFPKRNMKMVPDLTIVSYLPFKHIKTILIFFHRPCHKIPLP